MNIIIEGPDGVGKTTLVNKLKEYYNIDSIRLSYKDPKDLNFYSRVLEKSDCIFDRQFLSEIVYSSLFNRECQLDKHDIATLYNKTQVLNIPIFILDTEESEIINRLESRGGEHPTIVNNISTLREHFALIADTFGIEIIDTSKTTFEDIIRKVEEYSEKYTDSKSK